VAGAADNRGEDSSGSVITGETGLAHAGAVVDNQSGGVLVTERHAAQLEGSALKVMQVGQSYLKGISLEAYPLLLAMEA